MSSMIFTFIIILLLTIMTLLLIKVLEVVSNLFTTISNEDVQKDESLSDNIIRLISSLILLISIIMAIGTSIYYPLFIVYGC